MNAFFDCFVTHRSSLMDFVHGYDKVLEKRREDETNVDFQNINGRPMLKTRFGIEVEMGELYTLRFIL